MPTVSLSFTALPEHVRTARLVATAVARRLGLPEESLEEVRLAVGEACVRAVSRTNAAGLATPVQVDMTDDDGVFAVVVRDRSPAPDGSGLDQMALTLLHGLAPEVTIQEPVVGAGGALRLVWYG